MAEPDRPPGQRSVFHFGVKRVAESALLIDRAEVERDVEAKRQARKQREQDAAAAAAAAKRPWAGQGRVRSRTCQMGRAGRWAAS